MEQLVSRSCELLHHWRFRRRAWIALCPKWCRVFLPRQGVGLEDLQGPFQLFYSDLDESSGWTTQFQAFASHSRIFGRWEDGVRLVLGILSFLATPFRRFTERFLSLAAVHFSSDWVSGTVAANTTYKSFSSAMVHADIGLHIGLSGVNITLVGKPVEQLNETINYNEEFSWWFGSDYNKEFEKGLQRGLPRPILYVAEKFTDHSPCGLSNVYRMAGHYASATLWVAFCAWLISNMLFSMPVPVYGGFMLLVTGAFLIFALLSFSTGRNAWCAIQFGLASLKLAYGASFWLTLATGLFCFLVGIVVIALHFIQPDLLKAFFDLAEDEEDDEGTLGEVYVNPYFHQTQTLSSQPDFKLTIKNT
uniref:Dual oxidase maturation factor 2 n=1 Tax=Pseudonaja textilis TaxID=8673 RepID=A0A670Z7V0_PSETE